MMGLVATRNQPVPESSCLFCRIARGEISSYQIMEDRHCLAFLDHRPLFPGHCLLIPKLHFPTLSDLSECLVKPLFQNVRLLARAVEHSLQAEGSFVALNNRISQSVPHLHIHVVPRRRKDGLRGFFWPRTPYRDEAHMGKTQARLRASIATLTDQSAGS